MKLKNGNINDNTILEVYKTTFTLGDCVLEGYTANQPDPDHPGKFINYLSGRQLSDSVGCKSNGSVSQNSMSQSLKDLLGKGFKLFTGICKLSSGGNTKLNLWSLNYAYIYYLHNYNKSYSDKTYKLLVALGCYLGKDISFLEKTHKLNTPRTSKKSLEKDLQTVYLDKFGGAVEVNTEHGRIDLLTHDSLYEFKELSRYKEALGQLLAYGIEYPDRQLIAVFFNSKGREIEKVRKLFNQYSIKTKFI